MEKTQLNSASLAAGFTQSELTTMDVCPEKWYRGYNQMLRAKGQLQWWSVYGTAVHTTLQSFYDPTNYGSGSYELATLQIPVDVILTASQEQEKRYYEELLRIQMHRYTTYYANDHDEFGVVSNEQIITIEHEGIKFTGKIDLAINKDGMFGPMDHKTTGLVTPEIILGWSFRFQFLFYAWLLWKETGNKPEAIWWNSMKKPQLKQGKAESFESFMVRIEGDMRLEPDKYFKRQMMPFTDASWTEHFEQRILGPKLSRLRLLTDTSTSGIIIESLGRNMNTANCVRFNKPCEFLPLCKDGWEAEGMSYVQRETKHEELETE